MRRFRIAFAFVACVLVAAIGLLVRRALESVDVERRIRHETVAERIFDEMERALSRFVAAEEERPFGQYGSSSPALPFVIGYFQVDPDGSIQTPIREIEEAVGKKDQNRLAALSQEPGSTVQLDASAAPVAQQGMAAKDGNTVSAYDALRSLNKGVAQRAERQSKISREYGAQTIEPDGSAEEQTAGPAAQELERADRFELSPLVGQQIAARRLLLFRTVVQETRGYRQGFLVDVGELGRWLREQSLGSTELASRATLDFDPPAASRSLETTELVYQHRFGEPFEALTARLALTPLPGLGGGTYVYTLSALCVAAILLGLAALYRMSSVVLRYAEQRGNFVAAVTHELKTPLTAIRMYGEMLRDGIVASEAKRDEYYRHITAESERLTRLVNNVLEFSRLEKGARKVSFEAGDLGATVREVAELVRPHVEGAGFALEVELDPELPPVRFERDAVMQILFNLVDNAVKYADGAAPKTIELRGRKEGGGVRLTVRDHGPGVPSRHLGKIFEPFYRAENELTRRTKGTGLGLALVRGLAERMGARVSGRNPADGGFEVELEFR